MRIVKTKISDGFHFHGLLSEPQSEKKGIIIHIHGMAGNIYLNSYYPNMHDYYSGNGYAFLAGEHRGSGTIQEFATDEGIKLCGNAYEKFEDCVYYMQAWVDFAKDLSYSEIWLQGHNLGSSKLLYYITNTDTDGIKGLLLISPSDTLGLVHDPIDIKDHELLFPEAQELIKQGKGEQILSNNLWGTNKLSASTYLNFFSSDSNIAIFNYNSLGLGWNTVNKVNLPVLSITGTKDDGIVPVMDAYEAMKLLEKELKNSPKAKTIVYDGADHGFEGFEENIVEDVITFIEDLN